MRSTWGVSQLPGEAELFGANVLSVYPNLTCFFHSAPGFCDLGKLDLEVWKCSPGRKVYWQLPPAISNGLGFYWVHLQWHYSVHIQWASGFIESVSNETQALLSLYPIGLRLYWVYIQWPPQQFFMLFWAAFSLWLLPPYFKSQHTRCSRR